MSSTQNPAKKSDLSRRRALTVGGGLALAAMVTSLTGNSVVAQSATPAADNGLEGKYVVIRARTLKDPATAGQLLTMIREGFVPLLQTVPGFVSYTAVANEETGSQFGIGVYEDKAGADESTKRAGEWGALGASDLVEGDPMVFEGLIGIAVQAD